MPIFIRVGLAIELLLIAAEQAIPHAAAYLPIAGNHFTQLGVVLVVSVALSELYDLTGLSRGTDRE